MNGSRPQKAVKFGKVPCESEVVKRIAIRLHSHQATDSQRKHHYSGMSGAATGAKVLCNCRRKCGGPDGPGVPVPYSTRTSHRRKDIEQPSQQFSQFLASQSTSSATPSLADGLKRRAVDSSSTAPKRRRDGPSTMIDPNSAFDPSNDLDVNGPELPTLGGQVNNPPEIPPVAGDPGCLDELERAERAEQERLNLQTNPPPPPPELPGPPTSAINDINIALKFIAALKEASLDNPSEPLDPELLHQIRHPPTEQLSVDDPDDRLSLDIYLAIGNASEASYTSIRTAILRRNPEYKILSYYRVKRLVENLTGVVPLIHDMCINTCVGYTGPFAALENCPLCGQPRYEPGHPPGTRIPRKQFSTFPLAPQLQALWRTADGATSMKYRQQCTTKIMAELAANGGIRTSPYVDFFDGSDYLEAVADGRISTDDMVLMFSIDGAQLYRNKSSECWIYVWIILDHQPGVRYRKKSVLPGGIIGGPGKPKNSDSFVFPGFHHVAALQKEGLRIWDASIDRTFTSRPFLALGTADGPGMAAINGCVGHHGKHACRLYCPLAGRRKPGATHYYPARFLPNSYTEVGSNHPDVNLKELLQAFNSTEAAARYQKNVQYVIESPNKTQYEERRLATGISKPTLFSGFPQKHILGVPGCFPLDVMHLVLNIADLFIPLWRGTFHCDPTDDKATWDWAVLKTAAAWKMHGQMVADATPYIPGSFDRPPRNPAEKISSGYKAWEFLLYLYGLGPALLYGVLPDKYWRNYCKFVRANRILIQEEISVAELRESNKLQTEFSDEFEALYVQRRTDRLHFVRPSIHTPSHIAPETARVGPGIIYSQWALERTIGNLGEEIKQHSNSFANLTERALRRCQINSLKAMIPDLEPPENVLPRGSHDLGNGYVLLTATDNTARMVSGPEAKAFRQYMTEHGQNVEDNWVPYVTRWSRLRLPNGQTARSRWKESKKPLEKLRTSRNIKLDRNGVSTFAEVHFFVNFLIGGTPTPLAVVSLYGDFHQELYQNSSKMYVTMQHRGDFGVSVIDIKYITAAVTLAPDQQYAKQFHDGSEVDRYYLMEKPGLKLLQMGLGPVPEPLTQED